MYHRYHSKYRFCYHSKHMQIKIVFTVNTLHVLLSTPKYYFLKSYWGESHDLREKTYRIKSLLVTNLDLY